MDTDSANYISSTHVAGLQSEATLLVRERLARFAAETQKSLARTPEIRCQWRVTPAPLPPLEPQAPVRVVWHGHHPAILEFGRKVAQVDGVRCIVVEDVEGQIIHFTTFADPLTESIRDAIYAIEANTIDKYPDLVFDFHLRVASEAETGTPTPIPGQRFFAVWGGLDEKPERASTTGKKE